MHTLEIKLEVDGKEHSFREIWVHLQKVNDLTSAEFRILVPPEYVPQVFDPANTKSNASSVVSDPAGFLEKLGTMQQEG